MSIRRPAGSRPALVPTTTIGKARPKGSLRRLMDFNKLLNLFQIIDPDMPTQTVRTYVRSALAHPEPVLMSDLSSHLGIAQSSVSRNVAALSDWTRHHTIGLDLVEAHENPTDRRQKLVRLTTKGQQLLKQFSSE